jgi:hypothetical protein
MMDASEPGYQVKPHGTVSFEVGEFAQLDLIAHMTSDHLAAPKAVLRGSY